MSRETVRLRTEVVQGCVHARGYCIDEDHPEVEQVEDLEHDALYAHALLQAMKRRSSLVLEFYIREADKLMREWGAK